MRSWSASCGAWSSRRARPPRTGPSSGGFSDAAGTGGTGLGGLRTLAEGPDEALEIRVFGALQPQLFTPGGGHHGGIQAGVGADEDVGLVLGQVTQPFHLVLRAVGAVGDPDRPVLEGVNGVLVADRLRIETAILPHGIVRSPDRWALVVVHVAFGMLPGRADVVGLDPARGAAHRFLTGVHDDQRGKARHEDCGDQTYNDVGSPRPSGRIDPPALCASFAAQAPCLSFACYPWDRSTRLAERQPGLREPASRGGSPVPPARARPPR